MPPGSPSTDESSAHNDDSRTCDSCTYSACAVAIGVPSHYPREAEVLFVLGHLDEQEAEHQSVLEGSDMGRIWRWADRTFGVKKWAVAAGTRCFRPERDPSPNEWQTCAIRWLFPLIRAKKPKLIITLGAEALTLVTGNSKMNIYKGKLLHIGDFRVLCLPSPKAYRRPGQSIDAWFELADLAKGLLDVKTGGAKLGRYSLLSLPEHAAAALEALPHGSVAYDYETTGLDPWKDQLICVGVSGQEGLAFSIDLKQPGCKAVWAGWLKAAATGTDYKLIAFNGAFENLWDRIHLGVPTQLHQDSWLQAVHVDENAANSLKILVARYFPFAAGYEQGVDVTSGKATVQDLWEYNCADADLTLRMSNLLPQHRPDDAANLKLCVDMTHRGMKADAEAADALGKVFRTEQMRAVSALRQDTDFTNWARAGGSLGNPGHLATLLYDIWKLPLLDSTTTGRRSTEADVLKKLAKTCKPVEHILAWRKAEKLLGTYVSALPQHIHTDGRVHPEWCYGRTKTWRLSCRNPNLQNLPKKGGFRDVYVAEEGHALISVDFSQIELRVLAALSGEPSMLEAYRQKLDLHRTTASQMLKIPMEAVTDDQRNWAKTINFGIIYGMKAYSLGERLKLSTAEADRLLERWWETYPRVRLFMATQVETGKSTGVVTSIFGRKRRLPALNSHDIREQEHACNQACNFPIQCAAADITFAAMRACAAVGLPPIAQVHDELLFEVPAIRTSYFADLAQKTMTQAYLPGSDMLFTVDVEVGTRWGSLEPWKK